MPDRRRFKGALLILLLLCPAPALAIDLKKELEQLIRPTDLTGTRVAIMVMDMDTGQVLAQQLADEQMIPASNMKLLTTAAALDVLGPDFVFRTGLALLEPSAPDHKGGAPFETGAADGPPGPTLLIRADGDPAFGDPILLSQHDLTVDALVNQWVRVVAATGVRRFVRLLVDDRVFDRQFVHPDWPKTDLVKQYGAQVAGLNFYLNCLDVIPIPTVPQEAPRIELFPPVPFVQTINRAKTGARNHFTINRRLGTNELTFGGSIRNSRSEPFRVTIHDPPILFARLLSLALKQTGIEVESIGRTDDQDSLNHARPLHRVQTAISAVLNRTNRNSQNLFAEALIKRMGRSVTGMQGSWKNGAAAVRIILRNRLGPRSAAITVADGSGLSRANRVTARLMVELLRSMHQDPEKAGIFQASLSQGGVNGTLRDRFLDLEGQVFAKSGYLRGISGLSGYLVLPASAAGGNPHRTIGFSFLFNGFSPHQQHSDIKRIQNKMVKLIDEALTPPVELERRSSKPSDKGRAMVQSPEKTTSGHARLWPLDPAPFSGLGG